MHDVKLPAYEGPLDLLLRLIEKNEIDIYNIPIALLAAQYIDEIKGRDMEQMSEFLVMAATLLEIKSRMLLPKPPAPVGEQEEDPRDALVRKLIEYQHCQTLASKLQGIAPGERLIRDGEAALLQSFSKHHPEDILNGVPLDALFAVFTDVMLRRESRRDEVRGGYGDVPREKYTIAEKAAYILNALRNRAGLGLRELFEECETRGEMVVTFLALLELIRQGRAAISQEHAFEDITISNAA
jgi:segregation and condensation protein A